MMKFFSDPSRLPFVLEEEGIIPPLLLSAVSFTKFLSSRERNSLFSLEFSLDLLASYEALTTVFDDLSSTLIKPQP